MAETHIYDVINCTVCTTVPWYKTLADMIIYDMDKL
jgi:hypothetical protein